MRTTQCKGQRIQKKQNPDTEKTTSTNNLQCSSEWNDSDADVDTKYYSYAE